MTKETFDRSSWERRWTHALGESAGQVAGRPPNAHLLAEIADVPPGLALDAGCGHGAEGHLSLRARGGVGRRHGPATGAPTPAAGQVSVHEAIEAFDPHEWAVVLAEDRPRAAAGTGVDAVVRATRRE